ncbi:hypothetical protein CU098_011809 [Rhizopus stolonifer]|uniref:Xylanolytic transcriptional activator regulatory domain-containing protein n=1 Tax=Rhizopus stolonifer TaxID=4846 RepID=A0A367KSH1_RHIST|nr:hypothetical protein CU098_011809 [Rhizopus stolonifer]
MHSIKDRSMTAQERFVPLSFSRSENASKSVQISQFIKEALQILRHADDSLYHDSSPDSEIVDNDLDDPAITWELQLSPTTMTLDTSILTVRGLQKVLELIRINVEPQPPRFKNKKQAHLNPLDLKLFHGIMQPAFHLSAIVVVPRLDPVMAQQFNSTQFMRQCVQSFVDCGYSFFLDIPSLMADADIILTMPSAAKEHSVEALLILSICSLMARHAALHTPRLDSMTANMLTHCYYRQARLLLEDLFDVHHISVVISMFLLSVFSQGHTYLISPSRVQSSLLTTSVRMALAMDLHKLDTRYDKESDQKEKLRRLAWMLFCADYYADWNTMGQTGLIDVFNWHVDFPQPLPHEPRPRRVEGFSQHCRMVILRKLQLFKASYMLSLRAPRHLQPRVDQDLFQSLFNTPNAFRLDLQGISEQGWDIESLLLHEIQCHTQLYAQLPFFPTRYFTTFMAQEDRARCADLDQIYQRLRQPPRSYPTPAVEPTVCQQLTEDSPLLELGCLVSCLKVLCNYTRILEALATLDPIRCHHNPLYGITLVSHLCIIFRKTRLESTEIIPLCQILLVRIQHLLRQVRTIYADPVILLVERMLAGMHVVYKEDIPPSALVSKTHQWLFSLENKLHRAQSHPL